MPEQEHLYQLFQDSFYKYYEPLCQYAFTMVKEMHSCEDIVQETFLRIWEKKQNLIGTADLQYYLYTAIRNNCLTFLEKKQKTVLGDITTQEVTEATAYEKPLPKPTETDYHTLLNSALENLPPKCREIFVLSRVSGLTYRQIGDTMGISVKTVENQMGKALKILRTYIRQKQGLYTIASLILSFLLGKL